MIAGVREGDATAAAEVQVGTVSKKLRDTVQGGTLATGETEIGQEKSV
jgi:hypothetical protein